MCGIIAATGHRDLAGALAALAHRGPDAAGTDPSAGVSLGHTRLAIRDLDARSDQPFRYGSGPVVISYNGELFNTALLRRGVEALPGFTGWATTGDTEIMAAGLALMGAARFLSAADGMFAVAWSDERTPGVLYAARDRMGEVPLYLHRCGAASSELKGLAALGLPTSGAEVMCCPPGCVWSSDGTCYKLTRFAGLPATPAQHPADPEAALRAFMARAVERRAVADVPVCSLLSGGIDSAILALELSRIQPDLTCYTAVLDPRSPDVRYAAETAEAIGARLVKVPVAPPSADDLITAVRTIEMPFKAQVEIAWPCLALARAIRADGFKVVYTGEGSDELWASYAMSWAAIGQHGWDAARRDLIAGQAVKNFPRVNKAFLSASVEARLPWLDPDLTALGLSLPARVVRSGSGPAHRKAVLSRAWAGQLPDSVLSRPRLAFQDGLGMRDAAAASVHDPRRFYRAEYARAFGR